VDGGVGVMAAFGAGVVSFLSPCILPLVPGYLAFVTGLSLGELTGERRMRDVMVPSLMFVGGFSLVFVALGASASALGDLLNAYRGPLTVAGGLAVAAFGFLMLGVVKVPWLYGEARVDLARARVFGRWSAPVMGMAFALGWTPCVGPVLGSILMLAASQGGASSGALLLLAYSAGLGVPFLLTAALLGRLTGALRWMSRHARALNATAGAVLVVLGLLIATGRLAVVAGWLTRLMPGSLG
jgi:cytochrome c-type biogenesis protein